MRRSVAYQRAIGPWLPRWARWVVRLALLCAVAACGTHPGRHAGVHYNPSRYYPPPGPSGDPWKPYVHEASGRFGVPERWIRQVMRQESGGQEDVISWAGAMGLMQVMPDTYDGLRERYALGEDPFDPHNNILAGTAYLREMYDRFGSPGFLAAYNAGPNRLDRYLNGGTPLPEETVSYVAAIAPTLGPGTPMSGPLAVYGGGGYAPQLASRGSSGGCDADAAYDPERPCAPAGPTTIQPALYAAAPAPSRAAADCGPDAAYDPTRPCQPPAAATIQSAALQPSRVPPATLQSGGVAAVAAMPRYPQSADCDPDAAYDPSQRCAPAPSSAPVMAESAPQPFARPPPDPVSRIARPLQEATTQRVSFNPSPASGPWGVQVGAFANLTTAKTAADNARMLLPDLLRTVKTELPATTPFGGKVAFRARLTGLSSAAAADACGRLSGRGLPCVTVPPARDAS